VIPSIPFPSLATAQRAIRAKQISPLELTQLYLDHIAAINPALNAFITLTAESALNDARAATLAVNAGAGLGPLHGCPVALKDLFDVRGVPTSAGSILCKDAIAADDAFVTRRLRAAGAILLGKLNMHEWALGVTNINPHFGATRNPHNTGYITGGSSGGAGAALAAGLCMGALGSDTGGSIRIPASLCGVVGFKPTYGRVSTRGVVPLAWSLDHVGPMGRCVDDVALLLEVISGYDPADPASSADCGPWEADWEFGAPRSAIRVGVPDAAFFTDLDPDTESAVRSATVALGEAGFSLRDVALPGFETSEKASAKILLAEAAAFHHEHLARHADQIGDDVLTRLRWGTEVTGIEYANARRTQAVWRRKMDVLFESVDVLVLPATPMPATPIDGSDPLQLSQGHLTRFTRMFNLTGNPAIVLPCGSTASGLPIGVQIVAGHRDEARLLRVARALEGSGNRFQVIDAGSLAANTAVK
jgi:aspartyl-tRNA(Asn)/glutamyl-tRNA(Gln) amidotransferase subunit A